MITNGHGLPMAIEITGGQASDYRGFDLLYDGERNLPKVLIADRGYDADRIRSKVAKAGGTTVIPSRQNRRKIIPVDRFAYGLRNRIERTFGRMKQSRRVATRYEKTATSFLGFLHVVALRIWIRKFVNEA